MVVGKTQALRGAPRSGRRRFGSVTPPRGFCRLSKDLHHENFESRAPVVLRQRAEAQPSIPLNDTEAEALCLFEQMPPAIRVELERLLVASG